MPDFLDRRLQRFRQALAAIALAFEHVVGHALRGFAADAGQDAEGFDQLFEECGGHCDETSTAHMDARTRRAMRGVQGAKTPFSARDADAAAGCPVIR
jgi:hypothetical protein